MGRGMEGGWQMLHGVVLCAAAVKCRCAFFSRFKQGVLLKAESWSTFRSQRPYNVFYCWSRVAAFIIFWILQASLVSITPSCVGLMVSEAAKFSVNASLPLVRPVGIDFEEDVRGHNARGNE